MGYRVVEGVYTRNRAGHIDLGSSGVGKHHAAGPNRDEHQAWPNDAVANGTAGIICSSARHRRSSHQVCLGRHLIGDGAIDSIRGNDRRQQSWINSNRFQYLTRPYSLFDIQQACTSRI